MHVWSLGWVDASSDSGQLLLTKVEAKDGLVQVKLNSNSNISTNTNTSLLTGKVYYRGWIYLSVEPADFRRSSWF